MKKSALLLLLFFLRSTHCAEQPQANENVMSGEKIIQHAHLWMDQLPFLDPIQISLLANFLYFDYIASACEAATRAALINICSQTILMNKLLASNESEAHKVAIITANILKQCDEEILPARNYSIKAWQACLTHIENSDHADLKDIIISFQDYGKAVLTQYIKQDKASIEKTIQNHCNIFESRMQKITECNTALQAILDKKNPYIKEGVDRDLADTDVAIVAADTSLAHLNDLTLHAIAIKSLTIDLVNINTFIFKTFYHVLYEDLVSNNQASSIHLMFDQNGLIAEDQQDEALPNISKEFRIDKKHLTA